MNFLYFTFQQWNMHQCLLKISSRGTELKHGRFGQGTHSKFTCSFNIEPNFYPGIQLLIYHATQNGKFSEDSIFIPVKGNPTNNFVSFVLFNG